MSILEQYLQDDRVFCGNYTVQVGDNIHLQKWKE